MYRKNDQSHGHGQQVSGYQRGWTRQEKGKWGNSGQICGDIK